MLAGGEEYFSPPEPIDNDTLARFAAWCRKMRALEKPGQQSIATLAREGDAVGQPMNVKEIVAGTVMRCIKHSTGTKRYAYWCLLDKMAKDYRGTFAFLFEQQLADVGADNIEWEDPNLAVKYERLLEHWDTVFDKALVQQLWSVRRQERVWAAQHPEEAKRQREEEEAIWDREIDHSRDAEGLDAYGEPCLEYMKGGCSWGEECPRMHPPGLAGSLPPEARLGDWRCPGCGMLNRHFRRRCFSCVREKPQYKRGAVNGAEASAEVRALTKAEEAFLAPLQQQFGYDPSDEAAAVRHWRERLSTPAQVAQYIEERRRRYQSEILPAMTQARRDRRGAGDEYQPDGDDDDGGASVPRPRGPQPGSNQHQAKQPGAAGGKTIEISAPAAALSGTPFERMIALTTSILEEGVHAPNFLKSVFLLSKVLGEVAAENRGKGFGGSNPISCESQDVSLVLFDVCRLIHTAWLATGRKRPHAAIPFLTTVAKDIDALPLSSEHRTNIRTMAEGVVAQ